MSCLTENGAHVNICNCEVKPPADVETAAVVKNILKEYRQLSLKYLAEEIGSHLKMLHLLIFKNLLIYTKILCTVIVNKYQK